MRFCARLPELSTSGVLRLGAAVAAFAAIGAAGTAASADETVLVCDVYGDHVAPQPSRAYGIGASEGCPGNSEDPPPGTGGMAIWTRANNRVSHGKRVRWTVAAPTGLTISSVYIPHMYSYGIDDSHGWDGGFVWQGGSGWVRTFDGESSWSSSYTGSPSFTWPAGGSPYFGWQVVCGASPCTNGGNQWLSVELLELRVAETRAPSLSVPDGLGQASGWIRGTWPLHYSGDSPSGVCSLAATLSGQGLPGSRSGNDPALWHECTAPVVDAPVNTAEYGQGPQTLLLGADDAAGRSASVTKTIYLDNEPPTISLSGPTDAPTTAGVQYVTATGSAGPSGVAGILCSVDAGPAQWHSGATDRIPVNGAGVHHIACVSRNNARDASGADAGSGPATWTLSIREPSVTSAAFRRVVDTLRCRRIRERVRIPARWVRAYHHGHAVRVRLRVQTRTLGVAHCHPRVAQRRFRLNGRWVTVRVVKLPHAALAGTKRVRPGHRVVIGGWLGTSSGNGLGDQTVIVWTAPSDGTGRFTRAAVVRTAANGSWRATLPPGPSRTVVSSFGGSAAAEPSVSAPVHIVVPAKVILHIAPRSTHWGGSIYITGRLQGGYVPAAGELVVLRVGWAGGAAEIGHLNTRPDGTFSTKYTFLRGNGTERYRIWAAAARESDYPFAPSRSRSVTVAVRP